MWHGRTLPGSPIRVNAGGVISASIHNGLPVDTSVHWHGIALRNDADGVPGLTQPPTRPGHESDTGSPRRRRAPTGFTPTSGSSSTAESTGSDRRGTNEPLAYDDEWVIHTDGFPVQPIDTDAVLVGMRERYDAIVVLPGQTVPVVFDADNPGRWTLQCHNASHAEAGMMTQLGYLC